MKVRTSDSLNRAFVILLEPENGVSSAFAWIIMSSVVTDGPYFLVRSMQCECLQRSEKLAVFPEYVNMVLFVGRFPDIVQHGFLFTSEFDGRPCAM